MRPDMESEIKELVDDFIGSPPVVYYQLQRAVDQSYGDKDISFQNFADIIRVDPGMTGRLLRLVNSSFYGFESRVESLEHALSIVGLEQLIQLALATEVMSTFKGISRDLINMESFWKHSIAVGLAARIMASHMNAAPVESFYLAGMLHDIGSLILFKSMPERMSGILFQCKTQEKNLFDLERRTLGFDHAQVGGELLRGWQLPVRILEAVYFHHQPGRAKQYPLEAAVIHVGDILAYDMKIGNSGEGLVPALDTNILDRVNLTHEIIQHTREQVELQFNDLYRMFY